MTRITRAKRLYSGLVGTVVCAALAMGTTIGWAMSSPPSGKSAGAPAAGVPGAAAATGTFAPADYRNRLPQDEVIYFLLPDRFENGDTTNDTGGIAGDRLAHGFDPSHKGFYHGGDLKGLTAQLDYIQGLGATAIWLAPVFKNKAVQGDKGQETAAYHGYWVTDFTTIDPHFGTEAEFKTFVDAAHARGMKVYMDIITNHTADVIALEECMGKPCPYRSRADYPYQRKSSDKSPINPGFMGDKTQTPENFAKLTDPNYAYSVVVPKAEANIKKPAWLNDPLMYHNRGNSTFTGESSLMGDFVGLDDVMTENPRVIDGFIDVYGSWIDRFGVDGFRIDTAKHVNTEFWTKFAPAMIERAKAQGIPNFHIYGEVASGGVDIVTQAYYTRAGKFPYVLDFAFRRVAIETVAGRTGNEAWASLFMGDALYEGGDAAAIAMPTFLGNHDFGRFATEMRNAFPNAGDAELLQRVKLGHAMVMLLRGVPTLYSGDEQGFVGDGGDQDAREDMFPSKVASYNDNRLIGTKATTATRNFDPTHPIYMEIAALAKLRAAHPALRRGAQIIRTYAEKPGLFAVSRIDPDTGREVLVAFNTADASIDITVEIAVQSTAFTALRGACPAVAAAPGSIALKIPALDYVVCAAQDSDTLAKAVSK